MLSQWIHEGTIRLLEKVESWPQALEICAQPLLDSQTITPGYITAIIEQHHKLGPYYVLAPGLAMPHARPEEGARGLGLSLLKLQQGISFGSEEHDPVDVIIMLAAPDKHSHIEMISSLAELFSSDEDMLLLHQAKTSEEIKNIISRF
ncbi:PTS sugar transporter subunit IIA [Enterobacter sp. CC120223-11]|uniref:PTS sugar transporter subunit IIA n=1 Tax=Enterobacter sp. CC120223-11 TaxID=1378073 RepID=UPI000BD3B22B|nr:PTS sugar transporter subunit IIA [Enterobacter sp. CC120223-11]SNY63154.1 PTS system IIA component, L-Asc family (TC 4.A.7) [Enterobacter sp. CC120223-11]